MNLTFRTCAGLGVFLVVVAGCTNRTSPTVAEGSSINSQITIGKDGAVGIETGTNYRKQYEGRIAKAINTSLVQGWEATVTIENDPRYVDAKHQGFRGSATKNFGPPTPQEQRNDGWYWIDAAVSVTLVGDGSSAEPNLSADTVKGFVAKVMKEKLVTEDAALAVSVNARIKPKVARVIEEGTTVKNYGDGVVEVEPNTTNTDPAKPTQPKTSPKVGNVVYLVQDGDTLADISMAFFGTPNHWRSILEANPGMKPTDLKAGMEIQVPLKP